MPRPPVLSGVACFHCGSFQTSKAGFARRKQRYYCRECRRFSRENPVVPDRVGRRIGLRTKPGLASAGHLILALQTIAQDLGRSPTTGDISALAKQGRAPALDQFYLIFGSYLEALRRANLKPKYQQTFDTERLLSELRALRVKLKRPLIAKDVLAARVKNKVSSLYHFQRAFGSVPRAISAAGAGKVQYSRTDMIEILRRLDAELERPVLTRDLDRMFRTGQGPSARAVEREFGGMRQARRSAGIKDVYRLDQTASRNWQKYTAPELVAQLVELGRQLGRKPTDRDLNRASKTGCCASASTFARMFGSLPAAYRKAGYPNAKPRQYTDAEILRLLEALARSIGRMPTFHEIAAASIRGDCPSPGTITRRLGQLTKLKARFEPSG